MSGHKKTPHHLSQAANQRMGWVEGLTNLQENSPATALLDTIDRFANLSPHDAERGSTSSNDLSSEEQLATRVEYAIRLMQRQLTEVGEVLMEVGSPNSWGHVVNTPEKREGVISQLTAAAGHTMTARHSKITS